MDQPSDRAWAVRFGRKATARSLLKPADDSLVIRLSVRLAAEVDGVAVRMLECEPVKDSAGSTFGEHFKAELSGAVLYGFHV